LVRVVDSANQFNFWLRSWGEKCVGVFEFSGQSTASFSWNGNFSIGINQKILICLSN
jgi:ribosomal protein L5